MDRRHLYGWATMAALTLVSSAAQAQAPQLPEAEAHDAADKHGTSEHPAGEHGVEAHAAEGSGTREHGAHHEEFPNLVGFRVGNLAVSEPREEQAGRVVRSFVFLGLSYERTLIHRWLEAEISVPVAISPGEEIEVAMPFDLHFKIPFHPAPDLSPYIAAGPSLDLVVAPEVKVLYGVSLALGTYVWFSDRIGVDIELDYNLVFEERRAVHELLTAAGPVVRF